MTNSLVLQLLCIIRSVVAVPQSGSCNNAASQPCSLTGGGATYTESIVGDVRKIVSSGCPNNNPVTVCVGNNPNPANTQTWQMDIPATPRFHAATYADSLSQAVGLHQVGGLIGLTINGVEVRSCYGGTQYGTCTDYASSATKHEGSTFEYCGGHGSPYHYHNAPICLLQQMGPRDDGSSPLIGWAADGFPIYGNRGPSGVLIKRCGSAGAHDTYCADQCGGYYGEDYSDNFKYRYFLMGSDDIPTSNPLPIYGEEYFPFAPLCLLGCGSATVTGTDRSPTIGNQMKSCTSSASAGTTTGYSPVVTQSVTTSYSVSYGAWWAWTSSTSTLADSNADGTSTTISLTSSDSSQAGSSSSTLVSVAPTSSASRFFTSLLAAAAAAFGTM